MSKLSAKQIQTCMKILQELDELQAYSMAINMVMRCQAENKKDKKITETLGQVLKDMRKGLMCLEVKCGRIKEG